MQNILGNVSSVFVCKLSVLVHRLCTSIIQLEWNETINKSNGIKYHQQALRLWYYVDKDVLAMLMSVPLCMCVLSRQPINNLISSGSDTILEYRTIQYSSCI